MKRLLLLISWTVCFCLLGCGRSNDSKETPADKEAAPKTSSPQIAPSAKAITLYRGNAQRTGAYDWPAIRERPKLAWQANVGPSSLGSPVFADGVLYVGAQDGRLHAFDGKTGKPRWVTPVDKWILSAVAVADRKVYVGGNSFHALDAASGKPLWSFRTPKPVWTAPLVDGSVVYIASADGTLFALEKTTGQAVWQRHIGGRFIFGQAALADGMLFVSSEKTLYALDAASGTERWKAPGSSWRMPALSGGKVVASNDKKLYALDATSGKPLWAFTAGEDAWSAPAIANGIVYVGNRDRRLYALDLATGAEKWRFEAQDWMVSDPAVSRGVVYVGCGNHEMKEGPRHLYALDSTSGKELWKFQTPARLLTAPALSDGMVYVVTIAGHVYALR